MLTLTVTLVGGTYEAGLERGAEWPPHPGRVFNALVAQAEPGGDDDVALRWLEDQPPPTVLAPEAKLTSLEAYVPTNSVDVKKDSHQTYLGRTAGARAWHRAHPARDEFAMVWAADPPDSVRRSLRQLARRVPYVGRASSPVVMAFTNEAPDEDGFTRWEHPGQRTQRMRAPRPGSLAALRQVYEIGEPARAADRWLAYGPPLTEDKPALVLAGPYSELLTFGLPAGRSLDGRLVVRIAIAWRKAVLEALGRDHSREELALVHGHHDGTATQCAFLALPTVGYQHSDGQVRGLGVAVSPDLPIEVRKSLLRVLGMDLDVPRLQGFFVPGLSTPLALAHGDLDGRHTVRSDTWTGEVAATTWVTALPFVPDRFPHRQDQWEDHVRAACALAGYPDPLEVLCAPTSWATGAARLRGSDLRRRQDDPGRPGLHCRITFSAPLRGPVLLGHLRHCGLGLMLPVKAAQS